MKLKNLFPHLVAEVQQWPTAIRTSLATRRALFIARLRARWTAAKTRLARQKKILLWSVVLLTTALVAAVALVYLSRRSSVGRTSLTNVLASILSLPGQLRAWFQAPTKRRTPLPIRAMAGRPRGDEVTLVASATVVAAEAEEIPAVPHLDGRI